MRVAVLSDIHGNLPALEAVLQDVDDAGADVIVLTGDIAAGPLPSETLDLVQSLGDRAMWVRGNGDRWMVDAFEGAYEGPADGAVNWAGSQLTRQQRDCLAASRFTVTLDVTGLGPVRFLHATARSDTEMVLVDSPIERYDEVFAGVDEPTVIVGHTHMPFDRLADRRRVVNSGSIGMPYGGTGAYWALLGPDVSLRRTAYDLRSAAERLRASSWPGVEEFVTDNVVTTPSDAEALATLHPYAR